ncbi:MAG: A/G-specific adenine glycosylase [Fibrobacter sp.]|nr:A/G-specific adenine glycosylase [Fibrobacter sp.]
MGCEKDFKKLRDWFKKKAAELPWRPADLDAPRDPYAVWISETMLQQTQVSTVRDYFVRWMKRFPDIETLAKASEEEVFKYWQGLGYYSRARNILKTAKAVSGEMPRTRKELESLPGIGAYTAGAILSLAYHQREAILDGNLVRIFSRLYALDFLPTDKNKLEGKSACEIYWDYAREIADSPKAYMHNEALMELGRTVCKIKNPDCANCPLQAGCKAFAENRTAEFPPAKKHIQKDWHGTVLVIESADHKILAVHGGQKFFKNQFTLPHFESPRNATAGLPAQAEAYMNADQVTSVQNIGKFKHNITVHKIECDVLHIRLKTKAPQRSAPELQWVKRSEASDFFANSFCLKALALLP